MSLHAGLVEDCSPHPVVHPEGLVRAAAAVRVQGVDRAAVRHTLHLQRNS